MSANTDARELPVTAESASEIASIDCFTSRLLRIDRGAESILEDAKSFPGNPLIQLYAAAFCLFGQTCASDLAGVAYLKAAEPLLIFANERERMLHQALTCWARKDHLGAVDRLEGITERWPRDLLAAKTSEFLYYVLGQQYEGRRFLRHMTRLAASNNDDSDFLSMHAFAHELCGDVDAARRTVDRSLELDIKNPWAHHCAAHIYLREGDADGGVKALESYLPIWIGAGRVIHSHNAWHLAVAHLEALDTERALELFRRHIWNITPDMVVEQVDAISLLWRLEMAGVSVEGHWDSIADRVEAHLDARYMPFLDAHFVYALASAGRAAVVDQWLARVAQRSTSSDLEARRSWAPVGRSLVEASAALAQGDAARSAALLDPVMSDITVVGGSDAQVDLFRLAYFTSLLKSGRKIDANSYWSAQTAGRNLTPLDRYMFDMAQ